jgi:hypothetical protein
LECIEQLGLPATLFAQASSKLLEQYRQRVGIEDLYEIRRHPDTLRWTLLAAYCWQRRQEIIDTLVDLLIDMAHHLSTKAERRVEQAFVRDVKKVSGKTNLLFRLAEAVVDQPDGIIREVVFPVVSEQTLRDLVKEYRSTGTAYQQKVQKLMRSSYSKHYRRMIPAILKHLEFCSNNELHRPIVRALELLKKYVDVPSSQVHFAPTEDIPLDEVVPGTWRSTVVKKDTVKKTEQVNRINCEVCVLQTLRDKVRSKEVWVKHANRFRNPDDDLPKDFETKRDTYYEALHLPQDVDTFIQQLQRDMTAALSKLNRSLPNNPQVQLLPKHGRVDLAVSTPATTRTSEPGVSEGQNCSAAGQWLACSTCSRRPTCGCISLMCFAVRLPANIWIGQHSKNAYCCVSMGWAPTLDSSG